MTSHSPTTTRPVSLGDQMAGVVFALLGTFLVAVVVGRVSHPAGAAIGLTGAIATFVVAARSWLLAELRHREMLRDPAFWGLVAVAAAPFFPARLGPSVTGLSLDDLPLLVGTLLLVIGVTQREGIRRLLHPVAVPLYLFAAWSALAASLNGELMIGARALVRWGVVGLLLAAVAVVARRPGWAWTVAVVIVLFGFLQALFGLWAYYANWTMNTTERLYHIGLERWRPWESLRLVSPGRITGTLGVASNFFGALMIFPTVLAGALFTHASGPRARIAAGIVTAATFVALALSFTRASVLGALAGFIIVIVVTRSWKLVVLVVATVVAVGFLTPVVQRIDTANNRARLTETAAAIISRRPVLGIGDYETGAKDVLTPEELSRVANERGEVITPHNSFLRAAAETGIIGGLLLLVAAVIPGLLALWGAFRYQADRVLLGGFAGAMAGFGLQTFSNNLLHIPNVSPYYWLAAGAAVGLVWRRRDAETVKEP